MVLSMLAFVMLPGTGSAELDNWKGTVDFEEYKTVFTQKCEAGDQWIIKLASASGSIDLFVFEEDAAYDIDEKIGTTDYKWKMESVRQGQWYFDVPAFGEYSLVIVNDNSFSVEAEVLIDSDSEIDTAMWVSVDFNGYTAPITFGYESGDKYTIELLRATGQVSLYVVKDDGFDVYDKIENDEYEWKQERVTKGTWEWTAPDASVYKLVIVNDNDETVHAGINLQSDSSGGGGLGDIPGFGAGFAIVGLVAVAGLSGLRWGKKERS